MSICSGSIKDKLDSVIFNMNGLGSSLDVGLNNLTSTIGTSEIPDPDEISSALTSLGNSVISDLTDCNGDISQYDECSSISTNAALNLTSTVYSSLFSSLGSSLSGVDTFLSISQDVFDLNNNVNKLGLGSSLETANSLIDCLVELGEDSSVIGDYYDQLDDFMNTYFINEDGTFNIENAISTLCSQFSSFLTSEISDLVNSINNITEEISEIATDLQSAVEAMMQVIEVVPEELY